MNERNRKQDRDATSLLAVLALVGVLDMFYCFGHRRRGSVSLGWAAVCIIGILSLTAFLGVRIVAGINFSRHCSTFLKNAADANEIDVAKERLTKAVTYIRDNNLNHGFTSILWTDGSEDVEFWARNLETSLESLHEIKPDATELEKSNVLMKLRETILDDTDTGTSVTAPSGISVFPNNTSYAVWGWLSLFVVSLGSWGVMASLSNKPWEAAIIVIVVDGIIVGCGMLGVMI